MLPMIISIRGRSFSTTAAVNLYHLKFAIILLVGAHNDWEFRPEMSIAI